MLKTVYLDHNATTPLAEDLKPRISEWLNAWGNPSSIHFAGRGPKVLLREARLNIARMLGIDPLEIIFTSGGSEANNLVLKGLFEAPVGDRDQIIISSVEHPSLKKAAESMRARGFRVDMIRVNREGELDMAHFLELLSERTALVSVMYANNETGHILPIKKIVEESHRRGVLVHCDAVQALGKVPLNLPELGVDMASFSGHKFYSLKGCGILYARRGLRLKSLIDGGGQERGRRAGTENVLAAAAMGYMCSKFSEIEPQLKRLRAMRDSMEARILAEITGTQVTGAKGCRLPNTSSLIIDGVDGETLLMNLDVRGFAVSTGAACSSGNPEPSPVLLAMGLTRAEAQSSLRLSLGWENTEEEIELFIENLKQVVTRLRSFRHAEKSGERSNVASL